MRVYIFGNTIGAPIRMRPQIKTRNILHNHTKTRGLTQWRRRCYFWAQNSNCDYVYDCGCDCGCDCDRDRDPRPIVIPSIVARELSLNLALRPYMAMCIESTNPVLQGCPFRNSLVQL